MSKSETPKEPKLYFALPDGVYIAEHIPGPNYIFADWFRTKYLQLRIRYGKDIYYWHVRHNIPYYSRKVHDLDFIQHVVKDHDRKPIDPVEKRHFKKAWLLYGNEVDFVLNELAKDEERELKDGEARQGHAYAYAYKERWFNRFAQPESRLTYHGLSRDQYLDLLELTSARIKQQAREKGIDPETGKRLSATKK